MSKTILVVLKRENNVHLLLRRLEGVVKPGNRVVFLLRTRLDLPMRLLAEITSLQSGFDNGLVWQEQRARRSWEEQKLWAEENVAKAARRAFRSIGVEVEVDLYRHSLNRIVKRYLQNSKISLILVAASSWLHRLTFYPISVRNGFVRRLLYPPTLIW
jgi:hypothetical protein